VRSTFEVAEEEAGESVCIPSSRLTSLLENIKPGIKPRFFIQKIEANNPEKKIPSTAAKATWRLVKVDFWSEIHRMGYSNLAVDAWDCVDNIEGVLTTSGVLDVCVSEE
jgi:hypothetical protein